jgi:hypothetical protein
MRFINVLLSIALSLALALLVFEGGLRLIGMGPPQTLNEFHATLGWAKRPSTQTRRNTDEYDVTFDVNTRGLRDDPMPSLDKPGGRFRVLALGDSFTLGFTVEREDLFVDQLERWWQGEGRDVDVINAGTEGYSTDQETVWLQEEGAAYRPDLVLLFAYENDLYWNGQERYTDKEKPRFSQAGELDHAGPFAAPPAGGLEKHLALAHTWDKLLSPRVAADVFTPVGGSRPVLREFGALLTSPPGFITDAALRTRGALSALKRAADDLGAELVVVPIPSHSAVDEAYAESFGRGVLGLPRDAWDPDQPVNTFLTLSEQLGIKTIDPRPELLEASATGEAQYYAIDWHLNPAGNRTLAAAVHASLDDLGVFPATHLAQQEAVLGQLQPPSEGLPTWLKVYALLFMGLTALHYGTYRQLPKWRAPVEVGGMLSAVFAIVLLGGAGLELLPPLYAKAIGIAFVASLLLFIAVKLGRRLGTIAELFKAFTLRGHWYLMPLVVVLLSIGSLLVVAASSPLVAPFIYTLF